MKIQVLSDTHVGLSGAKVASELFLNAIEDMNENIKPYAIFVLGDLTNDGMLSQYSEYKNIRSRSIVPLERWHEVAGNHDVDYDGDINRFNAQIGPTYHSWSIGNLIFIFLSDESGVGISGRIGSSARTFTENIVQNNPDKNIFICHHHPVVGTVGYSTTAGYGLESDSDSWAKNLIQNNPNIAAWLCGHIHVGVRGDGSYPWHVNKYGAEFINVSKVTYNSTLSGTTPSISRLLQFRNGSKTVVVKFRNHEKREWVEEEEYTFELPFEVEGVPEEEAPPTPAPEVTDLTWITGATLSIIILAEFLRILHRERIRKS